MPGPDDPNASDPIEDLPDLPSLEEFLDAAGMTEQEYTDEVERLRQELSSAPMLPDVSALLDGTGLPMPQSPDSREEPVDCAEVQANIDTLLEWKSGCNDALFALDEYLNNPTLQNARTDAQRIVNRTDHFEDTTSDFNEIFDEINDDFGRARSDSEALQTQWSVEDELLKAWEAHRDHYCRSDTSPSE